VNALQMEGDVKNWDGIIVRCLTVYITWSGTQKRQNDVLNCSRHMASNDRIKSKEVFFGRGGGALRPDARS